MAKQQFWGAMLALLLVARLANAQDLIIYTENYPPYNYLNEKDEVVGLATEKVRQVMEETDLEYDIRLVPWTRAEHYVTTQNNALIYSMTRTPKREDRFEWLVPLARSNFYLFVRTGETRSVNAASLKSGMFTGTCVSNDLGCELFRWTDMPAGNIIPVSSTETADFRMVIAERADIYISDLMVNDRLRKSEGFDPALTKPVMRLSGKAGFYLAGNKAVSDTISEPIREAYKRLMVSGSYSLAEAKLPLE